MLEVLRWEMEWADLLEEELAADLGVDLAEGLDLELVQEQADWWVPGWADG